MPGYSGKALRVYVRTLAILSGAKVATAILVLGIPMADGLLAIMRRFSRGKSHFGRFPASSSSIAENRSTKNQDCLDILDFSLARKYCIKLKQPPKFYAFAFVFAALVAISFTLQYLLRKRKKGLINLLL